MRNYSRLILALLALLWSCSPEHAQVRQSGNVTPTHFACWSTSGVIQDCGSSAQPFATTGGALGPFCVLSAPPTSAAFQSFCLSATSSGGQLSAQSFGTAPTPGISFLINGAVANIPLVSGATVAGDGACFLNTSGTLVDCGAPALTNVLPSGDIFVGNASNVATALAMTGDVAINNTGATTLGNTAVAPSTYGDATHVGTFTVNSQGRITAASNTVITGSVFANPTASVGLSAVNGSATTNMRSDAAPPLSSSVQSSLTGTNHGVLLGTGAFGVGALGPCTSGFFVGGTGGTTDPTCQGYVGTGSSPVTRTWNAKATDIVSVLDYATCSSTDDTTGITNAIAATPVGGTLLFPKSGCTVSSSITITNHPMTIQCGDADGNTTGVINASANTVSPFVVNSHWVTIQGCYVNGPGTPSGNQGIVVGNDSKSITDGTCTNSSTTFTSTSQASFTSNDVGKYINATGCGTGGAALFTTIATFTNSTTVTLTVAASCGGGCPSSGTVSAKYGVVYRHFALLNSFIVNFAKGVHFIDAAEWTIDNLYAINNISLHIEDQLSPDFGHGVISNSYVQAPDTTSGHYAIWWQSGGETLIANTKLQKGQYGLYHNSNVGLTGGFSFVGGGIEACGTSAMFFSEGAQFNYVHVNGAYVACGTTPFSVDNSSTSIVNGLTLTGGTINNTSTAGIDLGKCNNCDVTGVNVIMSTGTGITVRSNCTACTLSANNIAGSTLTYSNSSTTTFIDDMTGMTFANLPSSAANGSRIYVSDGSATSTCTGSGSGAVAQRVNGAWSCSNSIALPVTVANGGTGLTSGTSGGIPYFSSSSAMTSSAALAANTVVVGGGAGAAPNTPGTTPMTESSAGIVSIQNTTASTSTSTGALVVSGGLGVGGNESVAGNFSIGIATPPSNLNFYVHTAADHNMEFSNGTSGVAIQALNDARNAFSNITFSGDNVAFQYHGTTVAVAANASWNITGTITASAIAANTGAQTGYLCYNTSGGVITYDNTNTCLVSSARFKDGIASIDPRLALDKVMMLKPSTFHRKPTSEKDHPDQAERLGLIAEDVAKVDERLIVRDAEGLPRGVLYETGIVALNTAALQALKADNDNLRTCQESWRCRLFGWR